MKLIIGSIKCRPELESHVIVKWTRVFCDDGPKKSGKKKTKRPVYTPDNPVSNSYSPEYPVSIENVTECTNPSANPECKSDDLSEAKLEDIKYAATNPECDLENPESLLPRIEFSKDNSASIENPPTTCCMSGCSNCVYIVWADALSKQMATADPEVAKKILEQVEDPAMKSFLRMELRNLGIIK